MDAETKGRNTTFIHTRQNYKMAMLSQASRLALVLLWLPLGLLLVIAFHCSVGLSSTTKNHHFHPPPTSTLSFVRPDLPSVPQPDAGSHHDDSDDGPRIAWLASFPNSGTSYTMTMVEQASNRSTASNYGLEVTDYKYPSIPLHNRHPEGPYWEGSHKHVLPDKDSYILTKTHCGGRCVRCGAPDYVVPNASAFLDACARTTARLGKNRRSLDNRMDPRRVHRVVHLLRNPFTNIVARFHLESRNLLRRDTRTAQWLPKNATGMRNFCQILDEYYADQEANDLDPSLRDLMAPVPCRAEFYKYTQWHNRLGEVLSSSSIGQPDDAQPPQGPASIPVLTLYYEDYHAHLNATAGRVLDFLHLSPPRVQPYRAFRDLPDYADHFTPSQRQAAWRLMEAVATPWTWERIARYRQAEDF